MFDLKNLNPPARFYYGKGKKEWVDLRNIPLSEIRKIRKETVSTQVEYYRPEGSKEKPFRYEYEKSDIDKLDELLWDYQIADWCLLTDENEKIECTLENKLLMIGQSNTFLEWILDCLKTLNADEIKKKEDSEKN